MVCGYFLSSSIIMLHTQPAMGVFNFLFKCFEQKKNKYSRKGILNRNNHCWLIARPNLFSRWTERSNNPSITWITRSWFSLVIWHWSPFGSGEKVKHVHAFGWSPIMLKNRVGQNFENKRGFTAPVVPRQTFFCCGHPWKREKLLKKEHTDWHQGIQLLL